MPDYTNGKIYVIRNHKNDMVYIGSTTQTLAQRMGKHRIDYKKKPTRKLYQGFTEYGVDEFHIELIEMFSCECKDELHKREGHFIREYDSYNNGYNGRIEGQTPKEYREANKDVKAKHDKNYREVNKEAIAGRSKVYREANKETINEQRKGYRQVNIEAINERQRQRRKAKKLIDDATQLTL
jgi:group I intron endonuclease